MGSAGPATRVLPEKWEPVFRTEARQNKELGSVHNSIKTGQTLVWVFPVELHAELPFITRTRFRIAGLSSKNTLAEAFDEICMMDGPLNARLAAYAAKLRELNFPFAEAYDDLVARLYAGEVGSEAPKAGEMMPPFILPSRDGAAVSLEELIADGPLVISFNRGHWCPFCKIYLRGIASFHEKLSRHGAHVVSIMPDRQNESNDFNTSGVARPVEWADATIIKATDRLKLATRRSPCTRRAIP